MSSAELSILVAYLEAGIPAFFQMFISSFVLIIIMMSGAFVAIFFLKIIRMILSLGSPRVPRL